MTGAGDSRRGRPQPDAALAVHVAAESVRPTLGRARVAALARAVLRAEGVRAAEISLTFVDVDAMAALNWRHLRHRGPTDIITFELSPSPGAPVTGDVYVCPDVARDNARAHGCTVREELARLVVHGMLHTLGHEHPEDASRVESPMWAAQERYVRRFRRLWAPGARPAGAAR
jgi:probable rRNA maturation factor